MDETVNHQEHSHNGTVTVEKQQQPCIDFERLEILSGFPNHCNGAEGIQNFGSLQMWTRPSHEGQALVPIPRLKQANKQPEELKDSRFT